MYNLKFYYYKKNLHLTQGKKLNYDECENIFYKKVKKSRKNDVKVKVKFKSIPLHFKK